MDSLSYKTEWWNGREVMPGESMRFVQHQNRALPTRMASPHCGGNIAPVFDKDKSGKLVKPKPHRPTPESYTVGSYLTNGDKQAEGILRDILANHIRRGKRGRRS